MTYGVDQCRVCGTPIKVNGPDAWVTQEKANRKPILPEKEWRAMGFLTSPTRTQLYSNPANGCCRPCGLKLMKRYYKYNTRAIGLIVFAVVLALFITAVVTFLPR